MAIGYRRPTFRKRLALIVFLAFLAKGLVWLAAGAGLLFFANQ
ncbi:MAG: hypothetical protein AB7L66_12070 [Gemmatimonadales bacterium]